MSTELVVLKDRTRPGDTLTLERGLSGVKFVLEYTDGSERRYWRFLMNEDDLWPLAVALESLAREADTVPESANASS